MDLRLDGKVALITGGTKGIGRACVEALLAEGARVAFCARTAADVEKAQDELGERAVGSAVDVADGAALTAWAQESAQRFGGVDVAVANVSALAIGSGEDSWKAGFDVDLMHTVRLAEAVTGHLEKVQGVFIAISSVSGREIDFAKDAYGTYKAAISHFVAGLAMQLAPSGARANTVSPGNTYFPGGVWAGIEAGNPDLYSMALGLNPTGRMARPEEVAYAVTMLASPRASFISGTNLVVDGALTRGVQL